MGGVSQRLMTVVNRGDPVVAGFVLGQDFFLAFARRKAHIWERVLGIRVAPDGPATPTAGLDPFLFLIRIKAFLTRRLTSIT